VRRLLQGEDVRGREGHDVGDAGSISACRSCQTSAPVPESQQTDPSISPESPRRMSDHPPSFSRVPDAPDRKELLTALTTEHFTLQGARSQTMSESSSRAALYIGAVSSTLVALGFLGQLAPGGDTFNTFALTVLPTLYLLGVFTFVRLVECGAEDFRYGLAINRIRGYYKQLAGDQANLFLLSGHDDGRGVFANASVPPEGRTQYFTFGNVVAVINSVVGGSAVAIALGAFVQASLGVAAGIGGVVAIVSAAVLLRFADRLLDARTGGVEALFPSPSASGAPRRGVSSKAAS
jgi:hypothetical protein